MVSPCLSSNNNRATAATMKSTEEAQDCIRTMLQQEVGVFFCPDYLSEDWILEQWASAEKVQSVKDCVNLVSELSLEPPSSSKQQEHKKKQRGRGRPLIRKNTFKHHNMQCNKKITLEKSPSSIAVISDTTNNDGSSPATSRWGQHRRSSSSASSSKSDSFSGDYSSSSSSSFPSTTMPSNKSFLLDQVSYLDPWRQQMCQWAYKAVQTFRLDRDIVALSFQILDRYLANKLMVSMDVSSSLSSSLQKQQQRSSHHHKFLLSREEFQLYSMTALYLAVKLLEPCHKLSMDSLKDMSRGYYSNDDIAAAEINILHDLDWYIIGPTPYAFLVKFIEGTSLSSKLKLTTLSTSTCFTSTTTATSSSFMDQCRRYTELVVEDSFFLSKKTSSIAIASILLCARQNQYQQRNHHHADHPRINEQDVEQFLKEVDDICGDQNSFLDVMDVYHHLAARV
mmetsp:Transcript_12009/g.18548  ORF Transcript_12009/g.18548 Transcript_12009/m.18548 type:complete len:452 (-) Transcript_12009:371-1726(-)